MNCFDGLDGVMNTNNNIRALDALKRAIIIDPENSDAYFLIGKLYENSLETDKAIKPIQTD